MKTIKLASKIMSLTAMLSLLNLNLAIGENKDTLNLKSKEVCLELNGQVIKPVNSKTDYYEAELIKGNEVVQKIVCKDNNSFKFNLQEGLYYAVKIKKAGFSDKLISINTALTKKEKISYIYKLDFKVELVTDSEYLCMDNDARDFPSAIIQYSNMIRCFDYMKEYTKNIKIAMHNTGKKHDQLAVK